MKSFVLLSFVGLASAGVIFEYKDEDKGIHHVQSGEPGVQVAGMYSFDAPEGEMFNLAYTAGEQGFIASGDHLPQAPEDTEDVAAARSSFMDAFMEAETMADEELEAEAEALGIDNDIAEVVVESLRRRRSPVTNPLNVVASSNLPSYTYSYANSVPLTTYLTYPSVNSYPSVPSYPATYAVQYPYYTYPSYTPVAVKSDASSEETDEEMQSQESTVMHPSLSLTHPVVRIGFQGLQPVQVGPVVGQPVQVAPVQTAEVSNERTVQEGDDEPAALAL